MIRESFLIGAFLFSLATGLTSCGTDDNDSENKTETSGSRNEEGLIHIASLSDYTAENHFFILDSGESNDVIFSDERSFDPRYPVQVCITSDQKFRLRAYSPRRIIGMKIWASVAGYPERFLLAQLDTLPPFLEFSEKLPFVEKDADYTTESGRRITIMANPHISGADMALTIDCDDAYYKKFSEIKTNWTVNFSMFDSSNIHWRYPMKTGHCREAVAMTINSAYMFSSPEYEALMKEYNGKFYGNGSGYGPDEKNGPLIEDNQILIDNALSHNGGITWGHVNQVGGLGGGRVLGLGDDSFVTHYADDSGGSVAWFHEFGHGMGYGDSNNTVISNDGGDTPSWRKVCQELYRKMCIEKKLPIYSRRFMHSRMFYDFYSSSNASWRNYSNSYAVIDDPELDEIDAQLGL
jgi:hypothetical protein